ncbi:SdpI family protein [Bacillus subtilis]|nr:MULTISPECIES: SdpI family protein [Bacillus]ADV94853.1 membrane protein SdpI [Bacillus subtilis BSn5]MCZ8479246.1 SdpI family protein [Bacillus subtilis]MDD9765072.1 SdpI family protein [Bacillus subtilis]MDD9769337.1 SdpI family protein [Bacillus subtilis]MDD9775132.1 SdpI family protein [Bacillus subtilis]
MMKKYFFALIMIALTILAWVITYSHLPNELATHWGISGEADDFSKKPTAIATLVGIMIVQYILMVLIPKIDPRRNYPTFTRAYLSIFNTMFLVLFLINLMTILTGLGIKLPIPYLGSFILGAIFMVFGNFIQQVRPNFFLGIRTPWTLSSENVWRLTHRLSSRIFVLAGIIIVLTAFIPESFTEPIIFIAAIGSILLSVFASYFIYQKELNK